MRAFALPVVPRSVDREGTTNSTTALIPRCDGDEMPGRRRLVKSQAELPQELRGLALTLPLFCPATVGVAVYGAMHVIQATSIGMSGHVPEALTAKQIAAFLTTPPPAGHSRQPSPKPAYLVVDAGLLALGAAALAALLCAALVTALSCWRLWSQPPKEGVAEQPEAFAVEADVHELVDKQVNVPLIFAPRLDAAFFPDPRSELAPESRELLAAECKLGLVGICGFYYPGYQERWDQLCGCNFLGTYYDRAGGNVQLEVNGISKTFTNAEAAFQALKFWHRSEDFEGISGVSAVTLQMELRGDEDFSFSGIGSSWDAMFTVLEVKFKKDSTMADALLRTGDSFLIEHSGQRVSGGDVWDNSDVCCENWLGIQLMLIRDRLAGANRWTHYLEDVIDLGVGRPHDDRPDGKWQEVVRSAGTMLDQEVLLAEVQLEESFSYSATDLSRVLEGSP